MTNKRLAKLIAEKTGYSVSVVRHILDVQRDIIRTCLISQESVLFPEVMRVYSETRSIRVPGRDKEEKVVLRIRPTPLFRKELNQWTNLPLLPETRK